MEKTKSYDALTSELEELRMQLEEATDTINAIRSGEVDALIVKDKDGHQLYTLKNVDQTYRIFIEQMTEGAVTLSQENIILYCNSQFATLVQLPLGKVTGQSFLKFITPGCIEDCKTLIQKAWSSNAKGDLVLLASPGEEVPVLLSLQTLHLEEGSSLSIIVTDLSAQKEIQQLLEQKNQQLEEAQKIARELNTNLEKKVQKRTRQLEINIQEKTKAEAELRNNQDRLTLILETMAEGVGIIDVQGRFIYVNPMAQKILGYDKSEILTRAYNDTKWLNLRVNGTPLPYSEHPMYLMMTTEKPVYDYEIALQPPGKERFYISVNAAPIRDIAGKLIGGVGTFMDVTNRRKIIQQKDEFISVASHELKTPMTTLKASLQLLERIVKTDKSSAMLPVILNKAGINLNKLSGLVEDLLNVSRLEEGQLMLKKSLFNMYTVIDENIHNLQLSGLYRIAIEGSRESEVFADKHRIEQVITNFINNAVKYAPKSYSIHISIEQFNQCIKVSVQDFGIGIPADKQAHLFDRYYRVDYSGNQYSGLGLGLYISSEIIKKHNGQIGVQSQPGTGSTFWFIIPQQ